MYYEGEEDTLRVYIGGPVNSAHFGKVRQRNRDIAEALRAAGLDPLDPLDFDRADELDEHEGELDKKAAELGVITTSGIVNGCLKLLAGAHYVLLDLRGMKATGDQTWGTPCEQMVAVWNDQPVIAMVDDFHSAWIEAFCHQVSSVEEAIDLIKQQVYPKVDLHVEEPFALV